jgi:hypothetical protein
MTDRPFQRSDNFAPSGRGDNASDGPPPGPNNGRRPPMKSNTSPLPYGPPSPEFSNLDCAFPPFVDSRSATPTLGSPSHPDMDNDYVRMHAEPNVYGPRSPRRENDGLMQRTDNIAPGPFAAGGRAQNQGMASNPHRRSASMGGNRSFGPSGRQPEPFERPSTAGPGRQRKPSLKGGPRRNDNGPPMPGGPGQGRPLPGPYGGMGQQGPRDFPDRTRRPSPPRQGPSGGGYGFGPGPTDAGTQPNDRSRPFNPNSERPLRPDGGYGGLGSDPEQISLENIPPASQGDGPYGGIPRQMDRLRQPDPQAGMPNDRQRLQPANNQYSGGPGQRPFNAMPSPTRSQTFPRRDGGRSGSNAPLPRRPSEPSPSGRGRAPSASSRNGPPNPYMPYNAGDRDGPAPRPPVNGPFPPRGQSRNGIRDDVAGFPPRGQSRNGLGNEPPVDGPYPPRGQNREGMRNERPMDGNYPPRGQSRNGMRNEPPVDGPFPARGQSRSGMRNEPPMDGPFPVRGQSRNGIRNELPMKGGFTPRDQSGDGMRNERPMDGPFPPRGPSRTGARGDYGLLDDSQNPYPSRSGSRNNMRGRESAPSNPFPSRGTSRNGSRENSVPPQGSLRSGSGSRTRNNSGGDRERAMPTLNTATDYDVGDPYHTPSDSASSNSSSVSVAQSQASSRSSPPLSEASYQSRRKPSDTSRLDDLIEDLDPYKAINPFTNKPIGLRPQIPRPTYHDRMPDSPTDPNLQQGRLSPISATPDRDTLTPLRSKSNASQPSRRPTSTNKGNCRGCGDRIIGKSVSSADGRLTGRYHKECFVCKTCTEQFATADFYVIKNHPYCAQHYHALNGSMCKSCDRGIEGQFLETEAKQKFHPTCFTCTMCNQTLRDDYFEMNGKPYCERDAMRAARQQRNNNMLGVPGGGSGRMYPERRTTRLMMVDGI